MPKYATVSALICLWSSSLFAQAQNPASPPDPPPRPSPTIADFEYGTDSPRQKFDFWQAKSDGLTPVVLLFHGGSWMRGDKTGFGEKAIQPLLDLGISVAAVNYRLIEIAMEQNIQPPVKACLHDAARALQTIRSHAHEWNIDPKRVGALGVSAGACTSLWLAMHDDLADPASHDPIARQSTRLRCAVVISAQTSLDPKEIREWIPNAIYGGHALGYFAKGRNRKTELDMAYADREKLIPWIKAYSPMELATSDDPPIFLTYPDQKQPPVVGEPDTDPTHSAIYGIKLQEKLQSLGVEAVVTYPEHRDPKYGSQNKFFVAKLKDQ